MEGIDRGVAVLGQRVPAGNGAVGLVIGGNQPEGRRRRRRIQLVIGLGVAVDHMAVDRLHQRLNTGIGGIGGQRDNLALLAVPPPVIFPLSVTAPDDIGGVKACVSPVDQIILQLIPGVGPCRRADLGTRRCDRHIHATVRKLHKCLDRILECGEVGILVPVEVAAEVELFQLFVIEVCGAEHLEHGVLCPGPGLVQLHLPLGRRQKGGQVADLAHAVIPPVIVHFRQNGGGVALLQNMVL